MLSSELKLTDDFRKYQKPVNKMLAVLPLEPQRRLKSPLFRFWW